MNLRFGQIGPLLRTQGPAASLLRPDYDPTTSQATTRSSSHEPTRTDVLSSDESATHLPSRPADEDVTASSPPLLSRDVPPHVDAASNSAQEERDSAMDSLTHSLASASLAFVPRSVGSKAKTKPNSAALSNVVT
jgi:hypothetical protein